MDTATAPHALRIFKRSEIRKQWKREVLKHCRHLSAVRMGWVMGDVSSGIDWSGSTKGSMAELIVDALAGIQGMGSARVTIQPVDQITAEQIAKVMLPFRMQCNTQGESGLVDDDREQAECARNFFKRGISKINNKKKQNHRDLYRRMLLGRKLDNADMALASLDARLAA